MCINNGITRMQLSLPVRCNFYFSIITDHVYECIPLEMLHACVHFVCVACEGNNADTRECVFCVREGCFLVS